MAHRKKVALSVFSSVRLKKYYILLALFLILFIPASDSAPSLPKKGSVPPNMLLKTWYEVAPYVELRYETWKNARGNENTVTITRFDLKHMQVRVQYQPSHPQSIQAWMQQENATAIINGGYFERDNTASALVISDGKRFGTSYRNLGGMLSVDTQGHTLLRSLSLHPYEPSEHLKQATQSFPMLLLSKGRALNFEPMLHVMLAALSLWTRRGVSCSSPVPTGHSLSMNSLTCSQLQIYLLIPRSIWMAGGRRASRYAQKIRTLSSKQRYSSPL